MPRSTDLVPMRIVDVRSSGPEVGDAVGVVLLEASDRPGHLPIFIGLPEAVSLAFSLENVEMPRPMTYQLASSLLDACGGHVTEVRITSLVDFTYVAAVMIETPMGTREADARPSDALNLAVLAGAPITADHSMLRVLDDMAWWDGLLGRSEWVREVEARQQELRARYQDRLQPDR